MFAFFLQPKQQVPLTRAIVILEQLFTVRSGYFCSVFLQSDFVIIVTSLTGLGELCGLQGSETLKLHIPGGGALLSKSGLRDGQGFTCSMIIRFFTLYILHCLV